MRTVADIEAELVRVAKWRDERGLLVNMPLWNLHALKSAPNGLYADRVMAYLKSKYPEAVSA